MSNACSTPGVRWAEWGKHPVAGRPGDRFRWWEPRPGHRVEGVVMPVGGFSRLFRSRQPAAVDVRWQNGEPVEFSRRPSRRGEHFLVTGVRDQWIEESPWPFPSPMPVGGDRLSCWRVLARSVQDPQEPPREVVLRMRSGPGVWDLVKVD